jgi:transcriptional regulator with XRE-family HTH domain
MTLGQKLTNLRKARGMTQEELSEAVGVTRQTISKWELDTSTPDLDYLCKLCDLFGVTADYLIRPEREAVETVETVETAPPAQAPSVQAEGAFPPPQAESTPLPAAPRPSSETLSGLRFAGWILFILGLVFTQLAILFILFRLNSTFLWIPAGVFIVIGLELLLIRWKPLFIVMWTGWLFWGFIQFVLFSGFFAVFAFIPAFILFALWVFYTAFCIGATVGVICKSVRAKRAKR